MKNFKLLLLLTILLVPTLILRFQNLGYSDYIGDEHKSFIQPLPGQSTFEFFMTRRKGPMQFVVSHIPYLITHDFRNELAQRLPYAMISVFAVVAFFFLVKKLTSNMWTAFIAAFLLSVNGFIVGFGRIAQYQNLNMLFSFLSLYFYLDLLSQNKKALHLRSTLLGTLFFCLSTLSHWDSIFVLPVIAWIFIACVRNETYSREEKKVLLFRNFALGCLILLPFLLPYAWFQITSEANKTYFIRRIELGHSNLDRYKLLIELYNPFITLGFLAMTSLISLLRIKKTWIYFVWFFFGLGVFELFVRKPGTHIYNFLIPAFILSAVGVTTFVRLMPKLLKAVPIVLITVLFGFFYYQSFRILLDQTPEYPWRAKRVFELDELGISQQIRLRRKFYGETYITAYNLLRTKTPEYSLEQKLPLFGFPHYRYWNEINDFINEQNELTGESCGYITNEVKTISEWYMDVDWTIDDCFYAVGVRYPLSFVNDYKFPQVGNKKTVHTIDLGDETVVKIYRVDP
jgi:hypothetical protein